MPAGASVETIAATRIQMAFRAYKAEIRARRVCMVTEDKIRRKKLDSQLKLEAKLHDLEVEWCGGPETMEEIVTRLNQREAAAVKRERLMAFAFSHQWRANSSQSQGLGNYEIGKANWGWCWKERWIAAHPWESRVPNITVSPRKAQNKHSSKGQKDKNPSTPKDQISVQAPSAKAKNIPFFGGVQKGQYKLGDYLTTQSQRKGWCIKESNEHSHG